MPVARKRRLQADDVEAEAEIDNSPPRIQTQRRRSTSTSASNSFDGSEDENGARGGSNQQQMIKNLVRLALSCEHARIPIRRSEISSKVLGTSSRQFRIVFDGAQSALRETFGVEMVELPAKDKVTLNQRRAAQRTQTQSQGSASSKSWVLCTTLPQKYRDKKILEPSMVPTTDAEGAYVGIYSFLITVITLAGGQLPEAKLERYLRRMNADKITPVDKTDKILIRMVKEGYLHKSKETINGEDVIEYFVGPRGKIEIGEDGVSGLVRSVYGQAANGNGSNAELEKKLERSLRVSGNMAPSTQTARTLSGYGLGADAQSRGMHNDNDGQDDSN